MGPEAFVKILEECVKIHLSRPHWLHCAYSTDTEYYKEYDECCNVFCGWHLIFELTRSREMAFNVSVHI